MTARRSKRKVAIKEVVNEPVKLAADAQALEETPAEIPVEATAEVAIEASAETPASVANPTEDSQLNLAPPVGALVTKIHSDTSSEQPEAEIVEIADIPDSVTSVKKETLPVAVSAFLSICRPCAEWIWSLRVPLSVLLAFVICPKFILLWIFIVVAKPISLLLYERFPQDWKLKIHDSVPRRIRHSAWARDLGEGADQGLPFILFWLYLGCAPFAIAWIASDWVRSFFPSPAPKVSSEDGFVFTQNKRLDAVRSETTFYYSRAFGVVVLAFFALGIPAFFTNAVFQKTGMEKLMLSGKVGPTLTTSVLPAVEVPRVGLATPTKHKPSLVKLSAPKGTDATVVVAYNGFWPWIRNHGVEPTKSSVFFVHFYLMSLATALSILFFRAWFLFPLNFVSDEHDVEFTQKGIRRKNLKSWFLSVITINRWAMGSEPDSLRWNEVKSLRRVEEGFFKLSPLPETAFKKESLSYKLLNKVASLIDGISYRSSPGNYLIFSSAEKTGDFGNHIKINLNDLNREQRARLFYSVKNWAPHVVINEKAEEQLLGSTVLRDNRYTQLWFDVLTYRTRVKRYNVLPSGESLKGGEYTIDDRISSGGQATTYLATKASGEKCVLKEFILATSSTSSAPIESAREFEAEVSLLSQLNHPGIVRLEDFFFEDGRVYVAMEYIDGVTLRQKVQQQGRLSDREVVQITKGVCEVLEYLHGCNPPIVHRDVTPENILVRSDGTIKLIDFSLAVKQDGRQTTDSCAKQCFTPPEQFREEVCVQSDIYALGATMYFLLTGLTPKPISRSSPIVKLPEVSPVLNKIVDRATELELTQRYESVHWLKLDLSNIQMD